MLAIIHHLASANQKIKKGVARLGEVWQKAQNVIYASQCRKFPTATTTPQIPFEANCSLFGRSKFDPIQF